MKKVTVKATENPAREYVISIGSGAISNISSLYDISHYTRAYIITDQSVPSAVVERIAASLPIENSTLVLPASESQKSIESVEQIWNGMFEAGCDRKSLVINVGGGVIGDVGGFAASTYMRGVDFFNVPTTLLAQVDASVGGKTGINFSGIKNLIGTFNPPVGVLIDPETLTSLPAREFKSGFAEIIKHGLIIDSEYFGFVTSKKPEEFTPKELEEIITRSCQIKAEIVQDDLTEGGKRKLLNFGHTVGHALEALSHESEEPFLHGEAISVGMVVEAGVSRSTGSLSDEEFIRAKQAFQRAGLPIQHQQINLDEVVRKMKSDKKNTAREINFTLLKSIGSAGYDMQVPEAQILEALKAAQST